MKKTISVTAAMVLVAGVLATYFWFQLRDERQRGSELIARVEALEAATPVAPLPGVAPSPTSVAGPQGPASAATPSVAQAPRAGANAQANAKAPGAAMLEALVGAAGSEQMRTMMRQMMEQMYPDVATELQLTPEEKEKLFDLMARQQDDMAGEAMGLMMGSRDPAAARELQRKLVEKEAAYEREFAALLGGKQTQWEQYQHTAAARQQVDQLKNTLAAGGNPLSEAQHKALVTAFAAEVGRSEKAEREWMTSAAAVESPNFMQESMKRELDTQRGLVDVASPHLNPQQLAAFRKQVEQQERMLQATMGMFGGGQGNKP